MSRPIIYQGQLFGIRFDAADPHLIIGDKGIGRLGIARAVPSAPLRVVIVIRIQLTAQITVPEVIHGGEIAPKFGVGILGIPVSDLQDVVQMEIFTALCKRRPGDGECIILRSNKNFRAVIPPKALWLMGWS